MLRMRLFTLCISKRYVSKDDITNQSTGERHPIWKKKQVMSAQTENPDDLMESILKHPLLSTYLPE